jgi:hypothetical protein
VTHEPVVVELPPSLPVLRPKAAKALLAILQGQRVDHNEPSMTVPGSDQKDTT